MKKLPEKKICEEYLAGAKQVDLATKYNVPKNTITEILLRNNIKLRRKKRPLALVAVLVILGLALYLILRWIATI